MKRQLLVCFVLLLANSLVYSQPYTIWSKTYSKPNFQNLESLWPTSDGNIIAVGRTKRSFGINNYNIWVVKTDAWGDTLWTREIGNIWDFWDDGKAIQETADGGLIIVGTIIDPWGDINVWLVKLDSTGNRMWDKSIGEEASGWYSGSGIDRGKALDVTSDGGFIISASTTDTNNVKNVLVIRTNSTGDTLWTSIIGGDEDDQINHIEETSIGDYVLVGNTRSFLTDTLSFLDLWLVRMDDSGNLLSMKSYEYRNFATGNSFLQTQDGGLALIGHTAGILPGIEPDALLMKTDAFGDTLWTRTYGDSIFELAKSIIQADDGGFIFTGTLKPGGPEWFHHDLWVVKVDSVGDIVWTRTIDNGLEDRGNDIINFQGGFVIAGQSHFWGDDTLHLHTDGLIARFGDPLSRLAVRKVSAREDEIIKLPVIFNYPLELSFNSVELFLSGFSPYLSFSGLDESGSAVERAGWQYEHELTEGGLRIELWGDSSLTAMDTLINIEFLAEEFTEEFISIGIDSAVIDSGSVPLELYAGGVQLLPVIGVASENSSLPKKYSLEQNYPNPFNPVTTIKFDLPDGAHTSLIIYNILGQEVTRLVDNSLEAGRYSYDWDASDVSSGVYIYKLTSGDFVQSRKMILLK